MVKQYTPEELTQLHQVLYEILEEIVRICDKHNIPYFVIGGTAIGALYDKAILPWDDDIDIGMKREDYNKFLQIASQELREPYFLSWIHTDPHSPYYFAKVKKTTPCLSKRCLKMYLCIRESLSIYSLLTVFQTIQKPGPGRVVRPGPGDFLKSTPCARAQQTRTKTHESRK